jgi:hypothetical protein
MLFPNWLCQADLSRVALVAGGLEREVVSLVCGPKAAPSNLVCDAETASRFFGSDLFEQAPRASIIVSRSLPKDCESLLSAKTARPTLMHDSVVQRHLLFERSRRASKLKVLAGYDVPASLLERLAVRRVLQFAREMSDRFVAPLVIHDRYSIMADGAVGQLAVFEYPKANDNNVTVTGAGAGQIGPTLADVEAHARFLVETELGVLVAMHAPLAHDEAHDVFDYWDQNLVRLAREDVQHAVLVDDARGALALVQRCRVGLAA